MDIEWFDSTNKDRIAWVAGPLMGVKLLIVEISGQLDTSVTQRTDGKEDPEWVTSARTIASELFPREDADKAKEFAEQAYFAEFPDPDRILH